MSLAQTNDQQTSSLELSHFPVMLNEILKFLPSSGGNFLIVHLGAGYSKKFLNLITQMY